MRCLIVGALVVLVGGCSDSGLIDPGDGPFGDGPSNPGDGSTGGDAGTDGTHPGDGPQTDGGPPVDLCQGLVTDKAAHPMTALARPALLGTVVIPADPPLIFHTPPS